MLRPRNRISTTETVIRPSVVPFNVQLRELWQYRQLFIALIWRNMRIEFDTTRLGSAWATVRPLLFAIVFSMFRNLSGAETRVELPYILHVYSGLLLWTYFTDAATNSASAVRMDVALLSKVYYPRLLTPLVPAVSGLFTMLVGFVPLIAIMIWTGVRPGWQLVLLPIAVIPCLILALGLGMVVSSLSVENRDWERVLAFALTIGLWVSPVIYSPELIPHAVRNTFHLNPMTGSLLAFRAVLFDGIAFPLGDWLYALASSFVILGFGIWVFRRTELALVDRL
ncbi:MAG: ABC transporter permease [Chloroflexi bacterium]|nr:ABC transporter permease [Chloroflexota bacterium]